MDKNYKVISQQGNKHFILVAYFNTGHFGLIKLEYNVMQQEANMNPSLHSDLISQIPEIFLNNSHSASSQKKTAYLWEYHV